MKNRNEVFLLLYGSRKYFYRVLVCEVKNIRFLGNLIMGFWEIDKELLVGILLLEGIEFCFGSLIL